MEALSNQVEDVGFGRLMEANLFHVSHQALFQVSWSTIAAMGSVWSIWLANPRPDGSFSV
jgi:hypothetical protein